MPASVRVFQSTDSGAPVLSGTVGALITVLDACLVNGYGSATLSSLVIASNVATATVSGGHGFANIGTTGPVIRISGATPAGLNGDWRVNVISSTEFTFTTSGISNQTASGTITAKRAPAGFAKEFSGTNKAAYRSSTLSGSRCYFRVDDSGSVAANVARLRGYEAMSDVDTGTGLFPTDAQINGGLYLRKYNNAGSTPVPWILISDGVSIYWFGKNAFDWYSYNFYFGDINSYVDNDNYQCLLIAEYQNSGVSFLGELKNVNGSFIARSYTQTGGSITSLRHTHGISSYIGYNGQKYPSPATDSAMLSEVECWESTTLARGLMPGFWCPVHTYTDLSVKQVISDFKEYPGREFYIMQPGNQLYRVAIDITGPWRDDGSLAISGKVTERNIPGAYQVNLFRQSDMKLLKTAWSDGNGDYAFSNLREQKYVLVVIDHTNPLRSPAIQDNVIPS